MTSDEPTSRYSSVTSVSTESNASDMTVKPLPALPRPKDHRDKDKKDRPADLSSRRRSSSKGSRKAAAPSKLKTDDHGTLYK